MSTDPATYCSRVCGGRCCVHPVDRVVCPHLQHDKRCGIYNERFAPDKPAIVQVALYIIDDEWRAMPCARISELIGKNILDPDVEAGCCYAHPELLERDYVLYDSEE